MELTIDHIPVALYTSKVRQRAESAVGHTESPVTSGGSSLRGADAAIAGGGSILQGETGTPKSLCRRGQHQQPNDPLCDTQSTKAMWV